MITTVTTSTITTVTAIAGLGVALGVITAITLIALLSVKELAAAGEGRGRKIIARSLNIGIIPLVLAFLMIVAMKVVELLG